MKKELFVFSIILFLIAGCSMSKTDMISDVPREGESYSNEEVRRMAVDQPFFMSGDYFRERKVPEIKKAVELPDVPVAVERVEVLEEKVEALARESSQPSQVPVPEVKSNIKNIKKERELKIKIGVLPVKGPQKISPSEMGRMAVNAAYGLPVVLVPPEDLLEESVLISCRDDKDVACLAGALKVYPGVRMLMKVEELILPNAYPGTVRVTLRFMDAGIGYTYSPTVFEKVIGNKKQAEGFITNTFSRGFAMALKKSRVMPWFCSSFKLEKDIWYLSAGEFSGLSSGDLLSVSGGGKLISAPSGRPAGWLPGEVKGVLRVEMLFGEDLAACSLLSGSGPSHGDILIQKEK